MAGNSLLKSIWEQYRGLSLVTLFLFLLVVGLFVYQTQVIDVRSETLRNRQVQLQKQLRQRQAVLGETGMPASLTEQLSRDLERFRALAPQKNQFADFIGDLFSWADQVNLSIRNINYQPKIDKEMEYLNYGLTFSVKGEYRRVKKFIHLLENSQRLLIVDKISLSGKQAENNSTSVSLQINLTTFFQESEQ